MGAGHSHPLYVHEHSPIHGLAPEAKIVCAFGIVVCVAITPREAIWAFGLYAMSVLALTTWAHIPLPFLIRRLTVVVPFVIFAVFIPFVASGPSTEIIGLQVSEAGLWGAWNVVAKALLGASVSILLTATTETPDIIRGLGVLRVPSVFTSIATFMIRYLELIGDELGRMRVAMTARGYDPQWLAQARPIASSAGALFVRSYERGERVHDAMLSRGFDGVMPDLGHRRATTAEWFGIGAVLVMLVTVAVVAIVVQ